MRIDPFFMSIFFRLINFFVLIAALAYLYKKYASSLLDEQIREKKEALQGLKNQQDSFKDRQQEVSKNTVEQEQVGRLLAAKIKVWQQAFDQESERIEEKRIKIASALEQRMQTRNYYVTLLRVQSIVIQEALNETKEELYKKFSDNAQGQQFIQRIVTQMERGKS